MDVIFWYLSSPWKRELHLNGAKGGGGVGGGCGGGVGGE